MEEASLTIPLTCLALSFLFTICVYHASTRNFLLLIVQYLVPADHLLVIAFVEYGVPFTNLSFLPGLQHLVRLALIVVVVGILMLCILAKLICSCFYHGWIQHNIERVFGHFALCYQYLLPDILGYNLALPLVCLQPCYLSIVNVWYIPHQLAAVRVLQAFICCLVHGYLHLKENLNIRDLPAVESIDDMDMEDIEGIPMTELDLEDLEDDRSISQATRDNSPFLSSDLATPPSPPSPDIMARHLAQWNTHPVRRVQVLRRARNPQFFARSDATQHASPTLEMLTYNVNMPIEYIPVWLVQYYGREFQLPDGAELTFFDVAVDRFTESVFMLVVPDRAQNEQ
ncbi:hypothetical protein PENANT_c004G00005 [Penicillium antarcticum]|uniref:Uncharacterized protein n=1 Tax=Penicillium antarcticum TaxID=416450 RepID=A0A1V6QFT6_9EURO|nr:uncharacterized protein N7508_002306 [Penicillium antarcticum]KAJ5317798.1 hypothetical protein N7508_002306 [Penicillium antarcticum]OQD88074.1 hypothetical protein PENANT_c004G00005 [Penicillium antarcticum]